MWETNRAASQKIQICGEKRTIRDEEFAALLGYCKKGVGELIRNRRRYWKTYEKIGDCDGKSRKVREIKKIWRVYDDLLPEGRGIAVDNVEDADSFLGNAAEKALTISRLVDCDVLADDSGLCVDGLGGRPGDIRPGIPQAETDEDNNKKLVEECAALDEEGRRASYVCAIVLAQGGQEIYSCEGNAMAGLF